MLVGDGFFKVVTYTTFSTSSLGMQHDDSLQWHIQCAVQLLLLNQLGDHRHHLAVSEQFGKQDRESDFSIKKTFVIYICI